MSRLPQEGWKTARRAMGLGLLGTCLAASGPAFAGCVACTPGGQTSETQAAGSGAGSLDSTFARAIGLAPAAGAPDIESQTADPISTLSHFSTSETAPQRTPLFDVAPPNPFVISTSGKPSEPVKSIPNLPALWSGITGLAGLGAIACVRRVRRVVR